MWETLGRPLPSDILFPLQPPPPPPTPDKPPRLSHPKGLDFGPFRLRLARFGSVWLRFGSVPGPFRVRFGSVSGVLGGVGVGPVRGASVREKSITTFASKGPFCTLPLTTFRAIFPSSGNFPRSTASQAMAQKFSTTSLDLMGLF